MPYTWTRTAGTAQSLIIARLGIGDEVVSSLKDLARRERLAGAAVTGLGAVREVTLAFYDLKAARYIETHLEEELEVASMVGNLSWLDDEPVAHLHGVVSRRDATTAAGHIMRAVVSVTLEVMLNVYPGKIKRGPDPDVGLNLLDLM